MCIGPFFRFVQQAKISAVLCRKVIRRPMMVMELNGIATTK